MTTAPTRTFRFREVAEALGGATTVSPKDSALIVIDAQRFYLPDGMWSVHDIAKTNKVIDELVEKYRKVSPSCSSQTRRRRTSIPRPAVK